MELQDLTDEQLEKVHEYYMEVESLNKTTEWFNKKYKGSINRHQLSLKFKENDLYVQPANGQPEGSNWRINKHSPQWQLAFAILKQALKDIEKYKEGKGSKIDFLSACYFFASDFYRDILSFLNDGIDINDDILPEGLNETVVRLGAGLYKDQYNYWVAN